MAKQTTRIMVLGVVASRQPLSGYGIEKVLAEWAVDRWTTIAPASIYQQLRSLTAASLIEQAADGTTRRAIEYRCTATGRDELHRLLLALLNEQDFQPLSLIPLLHFTPALTAVELATGLRRRVALIDQALAHEPEVIERAEASGPAHVAEIFRLTWHGYRADRAWCQEFLTRLESASV